MTMVESLRGCDNLVILMVDPAKSTGWACSDGTSGVERFDGGNIAKLPEPERHALIADRFARWLDAKLQATQAGVLGVERMMTHGTAAHLLLGLRMVALLAGWRRKLLVEEVWESQWKPFARKNTDWVKGDEADAQAMLAWWSEFRLPEVRHV